ncbi:tetratricopeptide repeat protein 31-like isoform X2 [Sphaeramia orbicularis]|uniref:tetratricopeptide repeat protein 31-like isoform X2 n=1 Tax=Sphaeramia orbicularis TaxID=375764 RepID=UPI00117F4D05|nr:tetratricopeptide repeat protein 31-like isoform X2 [Sphaeramia orbicularis]
MDMFTEDAEFIDINMMIFRDMFRRCSIQRMMEYNLLGLMAPDDELSHFPSIDVQAKDSNVERKARLLQESKKSKEKKRLKKQKQKERKRREKLEREKQNPVKDEEVDKSSQSKEPGSKSVNDKSKDGSIKDLASAKDTDSSDSSADESSDEDSDNKDSADSEELDLTSTFVTKAAEIARRKMEQKPRPEKKKTPVKTTPKKTTEDQDVEKKLQDSMTLNMPDAENNIKISTQLALLGNKFASAGDFSQAVKYFTDAIKYNPTEFKLFGNRAFCFEKMQEYEKALTDAELCLSMCPGWDKGLFRKGRALAGLKRYTEAADTFREVLKLNSSCGEAAQDLMRVQIIQLMDYGFSQEQSSNALIIHGTFDKALEVLSKLNHQPGPFHNSAHPPAQVVNVTGVSPVLSAKMNSATPHPPPSHSVPKPPLQNVPLGPVQNVQTQQKTNNERPPPELFPVWVGNLNCSVTETMISNLFNEAGVVYSVKLLVNRRCAFVNFTKPECCDKAIQRFHGFELKGVRLAVRYPDRIPPGMGISKSALKADENIRQNQYMEGRYPPGPRKPFPPYHHVHDPRGFHKY